ncbi:hypothetical protein HN587_04270 [Candidatus Woesearchaeota archaeon]|nr:hypothetical protein [Candidatus Woesearchaeota archaeon]
MAKNLEKKVEETVTSRGSTRYPDDDRRVPDAEPFEAITYTGPSYPDDDRRTPNRTVFKQGAHIYSEGNWYSSGEEYCGPKYPDD